MYKYLCVPIYICNVTLTPIIATLYSTSLKPRDTPGAPADVLSLSYTKNIYHMIVV